jgi:hypothetical protein
MTMTAPANDAPATPRTTHHLRRVTAVLAAILIPALARSAAAAA